MYSVDLSLSNPTFIYDDVYKHIQGTNCLTRRQKSIRFGLWNDTVIDGLPKEFPILPIDAPVSFWDKAILGLNDYLMKVQQATGKRKPTNGRLRSILYDRQGKRRKMKFIILSVLSCWHKGKMNLPLKKAPWHAHLLILGDNPRSVVELIKYYWCDLKRYGWVNSHSRAMNVKARLCWNEDKLLYNLEQAEGVVSRVSPWLTRDDLLAMGFDADAINSKGRLKPSFVTERIEQVMLDTGLTLRKLNEQRQAVLKLKTLNSKNSQKVIPISEETSRFQWYDRDDLCVYNYSHTTTGREDWQVVPDREGHERIIKVPVSVLNVPKLRPTMQ